MTRRGTLVFLTALAALLLLGWLAFRPAERQRPQARTVALWTAGASLDDAAATRPGRQAALPGAVNAPAGVLRVGDTADLRRRFPDLEEVHILGDGIEATDAAALHDLAISWQRPARAETKPALAAISVPHRVSIGQRITVQGKVAGIGDDGARVVLESPDGTIESVQLAAAAEANAPFSLSSSPARTAGEFEWLLRLEPGGERVPLGVSVTAPPPPTVLLLQASPSPELGRLQRWLHASATPFTARTRVSAERFRFDAAPGAPAEFTGVSRPLLTKFDLIVTTEAALAELERTERTAVDEAVRQGGLGLLVLGDSYPGPTTAPLLPWRVQEPAGDAAEDRRLMRLRLADGSEIAEWITLAAPQLESQPLQRVLVQDPQDRVLAAAVRQGQGWIARSLLLDTWRWEQAGHAEAFSAYWAGVLNTIARPAGSGAGRWALHNPNEPRFVNEPIRLSWLGPPNTVPPAAHAQPAGAGERIPLYAASDSAFPESGHAIYWPPQAGWHRVQSENAEEGLAFFVHADDALRHLQIERRRVATAALAARAKPNGLAPLVSGGRNPDALFPLAAFGVFLASMTVLWFQERRGRT